MFLTFHILALITAITSFYNEIFNSPLSFYGTTLVLGQDNYTVADSLLLGRYTLAAQGEDFKLQPEAAKAFTAMRKAAFNDSIRINVVSSFRSYSSQKRIWNRKYKRFVASGMSPTAAIEKIIEYSTLPGTSRHHWGTDIDLVLGNVEVEGDILSETHFHDGGAFEKLRLWLEKMLQHMALFWSTHVIILEKGSFTNLGTTAMLLCLRPI